MYIPEEFVIDDRAQLHQIIRDNNFGALIGMVEGRPTATHLPFMLDADRGAQGTLLVHMARANPHWKSFGEDEVLVIFSGPHGYVSPSWYEPGNAVPTWNYVAVHAYGVPVLADGDADTVDHLRQLVDAQEARFEAPWSLDSQDPAFVTGMSKGVVAFEIPIQRLEGKAKLNQNRTPTNQARVVAALERSADPADTELARVTREILGDLPTLD
jgi:transcriptional regulator